MEWVRGGEVGRGSFGIVNFAIPKPGSQNRQHPPLTVVKSSDFSMSGSLRNEREILRRIGGRCPQVIRCYGDARTAENGRDVYNLFLEYAAGGSLADQLRRKSLNRFTESEARRHANSIVRGLAFIHDCGFVHCDIKLQNVLVFDNGEVKISDFGLAKEDREENGEFEFRGTPLYMAPEVVAGGNAKAPADVWALGCAVVEMVTGRPAWRCEPGCGVGELLCRIGAGRETPEIPESISEEGKDFVSKCFVKDPSERWTARMLLGHPFLSSLGDEEEEEEEEPSKTASSPRDPFDFPDWPSTAELYEPSSSPEWEKEEKQPCSASILKRVEAIVDNPINLPDWSDVDDGWVAVR